MLKFGDSMISLHMLSQIPSSCLCIQLSVCATSPRILTSFFQSHAGIMFCTDKIESTEWQDLVPRRRTGDCLWIHIRHRGLCDLPSSKSPNFSARGGASPVRLLQLAFVILVLKQTSQFRSFGK